MARVVSVLSLVLGYFSMLVMALVVYWLVTGRMVLYKEYKEPPDFMALDMPPDFMPADMPFEAPNPALQRAPTRPAER